MINTYIVFPNGKFYCKICKRAFTYNPDMLDHLFPYNVVWNHANIYKWIHKNESCKKYSWISRFKKYFIH